MTFFIDIDYNQVEIDSNISILQACEIIDVVIPRFCYHERLSVAGNCRMCLVEVEKMPKLQASCAVSVVPNMIIRTNTLAVKKAREGILEFLLINHPLDCPICDQGGECDLQEQSLTYGGDRSRFKTFKRAVEDKNCGPLVKTVMTRCIHCTRCVRFVNEVIGTPDLGTSGRGNSIEIGTYITKFFSSELSGNVIDLCPVGALTSKPYAFLSRPWELRSTESIDVFDSLHSNIRVDTRGYDILRIMPRLNESINEEWISDKVRFCFDGLSVQRLTTPLLKHADSGNFYPVKWSKAIEIVKNKVNLSSPNKTGLLIGPLCDWNSLVALKRLSLKFNFAVLNNSSLDTDYSDNYKFNTFLKNVRKSDVCLIVGVNPRTDGVLLNYHLRKGFLNSNLKVGYVGSSLNLSFPSLHLGSSLNTLFSILEGKNLFCKLLRQSKTPMIVFGDCFFKEFGYLGLNLVRNLVNLNMKTFSSSWRGLNFFNLNSSEFSLLDLSLQSNYKFVSNSFDLLYILENYNSFDKKIKSKFVVFQGHHGCQNAQKADIILPCSSFVEKLSSSFNCEGRYQYSYPCLPSLTHSKESCIILSCFLPPYNGYDKLLYPSLEFSTNKTYTNFFSSISTFNVQMLLSDNYMRSSPFDNFYRTDIISTLSLNMAKSSSQLLNKIPFKSLAN